MTKTDRDSRRVVITGMGIICPLGHDVEAVWKAVLSCTSGMDYITIFDASTYPTRFDAEVKGFDIGLFVRNTAFHGQGNRGCQFGVAAAAQACRQAGIDIETDTPRDGIHRDRLGIYLGAGEGSVDNDVFFDALVQSWNQQQASMDWTRWARIAVTRLDPVKGMEQEPHMPAWHIAVLTGARGPVRSCLTACAASTQAVGEAMMMIRSGNADVVIAGGCHSMIHPLGVMGFCRLTALSTKNNEPRTASRPFSSTRDGFVIGEGAAMLILESLESAKRRGVRILAEIVGYGTSADAFRVTDMHEQGRGPIQAMPAALRDAGLRPDQIGYIKCPWY